MPRSRGLQEGVDADNSPWSSPITAGCKPDAVADRLSHATDRPDAPAGADLGIIITCEHGGNRVPDPYRKYFTGRNDLLRSSQAYDPGAIDMARSAASAFGAPLIASRVTRLLVDLNRALTHPELHDEAVHLAPKEERTGILNTYYHPYRKQAEELIGKAIEHHGCVLHLSCNSFEHEPTDSREADIGLLYDRRREPEKLLCERWQSHLTERDQRLSIRRNYPLRRDGGSLMSKLRRRYDADTYMGVDLVINQRHAQTGGHHWSSLRTLILESLGDVLQRPIRTEQPVRITYGSDD